MYACWLSILFGSDKMTEYSVVSQTDIAMYSVQLGYEWLLFCQIKKVYCIAKYNMWNNVLRPLFTTINHYKKPVILLASSY
jgi:hypothetical protein